MNYDVFISYRRDGGFETAKHLNDLLVSDGYTVSFDIDTLREGDFDKTLLKRIDQCVDFILVVDKHTFDRTLDPDFDPDKDWLRIELAYALELKKNIIPLLLSGVDGFPDSLPEDIADVATKNGPEYNKYYFDEFYRRLKSFLRCIPRNAKLDDKEYATVTFCSDSDVSISVDGEHIANVKANEFSKAQIEIGEHILEFISIQDASKHYSEVHSLNEIKNYVVQVKLKKGRVLPVDKSAILKSMLVLALLVLVSFGVYLLLKDKPKEENLESDTVEYPTNVEVKYYNDTLFVNGLPYKMILIKGGEIYMSIDGDEETQKHTVTLSDYKIGETEVPQSIWEAIMGSNPSNHVGPNYPVEQISWYDCQRFIARLNKLSGYTFRLPTEAEWVYVAKAYDDKIDRCLVGGPSTHRNAYGADFQNIAWYRENSDHRTHEIGTKGDNRFGPRLKDIFGNVWEWCSDRYEDYIKDLTVHPIGPSTGNEDYIKCDTVYPKDPTIGEKRVFKGGGCGSEADACSPWSRGACMPDERWPALGFRLAM